MSEDRSLDRRAFLGVAAATGAAALVGSAGGQTTTDGNGTATNTTTDATTTTETTTSAETNLYPNASLEVVTSGHADDNFNPLRYRPYSPAAAKNALFEPLARYSYDDGTWEPVGLEDWTYTGDAFEMTVREGLQWSNGDAVTARDLAIQFELAIASNEDVQEWATLVETVDDRTLRLHVDGDHNPALLEHDVLVDRHIATDRATYGPKLAKLDADETNINELADFVDDDPVTCGPFELEGVRFDGVYCTRADESPWSDGVNIGHLRLTDSVSQVEQTNAILDDEADAAVGLPVSESTANDLSAVAEPVEQPDVAGMALVPNHDDPHVGDRSVRQAIAHVVDRRRCIQASTPRIKKTPAVPTGIATTAQDRWLGEVMDQYDDYGPSGSQQTAATAVLEDAGYEKRDGTWVDEGGTVVSLEVTVSESASEWVLAADVAVEQLAAFGFDATVRTISDLSDVIHEGNFQLVATDWLHGGPTTYPYETLRYQLWEPDHGWLMYNYPPSRHDSGVGGEAATVSVPARGGAGEASVDVMERLEALRTTADPDQVRSIVRELAWVANQDLPMIPLFETYSETWLRTDDWAVAPVTQAESGAIRDPLGTLFRSGTPLYTGEPTNPPDPVPTPYPTPEPTPEPTPNRTSTITPSTRSSLERGESTGVALQLTNRDEGVDAYELSVSVDGDEAILVDAALPPGVTDRTAAVADDNQSATLSATDAEAAIEPGTGAVSLGEVRLAGRDTGTVTLSVTVEQFRPDTGSSDPSGRTAEVTVTESTLDPVDFEVPMDLDGDGDHMDLTANGQLDYQDVVQYFSEMEGDSLAAHPDAYDYSGNGEIDYQDLIALFQSI